MNRPTTLRSVRVAAGGLVAVLLIAAAALALTAAGDDATDPGRPDTDGPSAGVPTGAGAAPLIVHPASTDGPPSTAMRLVTPAPTRPAPSPMPTPVASTTTVIAPPPVTAGASPGLLDVEVSELDLGAERAGATIVVANTGGRELVWSTLSDHPLVRVAPGGRLAPGEHVDLTVTVDRGDLVEGDYYAYVSVLGGGKGWPVTVRWRVERPPVLHLLAPAPTAGGDPCPDDPPGRGSDPGTVSTPVPTAVTGTVTVTVVDESDVAAVELTWSGPGPAGSAGMTRLGDGHWRGTATPLTETGTWTLTVAATDGRGNTGTATTTVTTSGAGVVTKGCRPGPPTSQP